MKNDKETKRDWVDLIFKVMAPILAGLLIAWAGFVGNKMLSSISSKQESARLITELQIKREQDDMVLRKDVFDKALDAFLLKKQDNGHTLAEMSKQLLRLELLSLNFGDSLCLSPLFVELKNDLDSLKPVIDVERRDFNEHRAELRKRLETLAKRLSKGQVSSLSQHGTIKEIRIPLNNYKEDDSCKKTLFEESDFAWPDDVILKYMEYKDYKNLEENEKDKKIFQDAVEEKGLIELNGVKRHLELHISDVNPCRKTAKVQIILKKDDPINPEVNRTFRLDYYNFPMVDNTRLSENQRFAIIMEEFELKGSEPYIDIIGIVFPSEYASLRDRPGMQEARKLLESALKDKEKDSNE